MSSYEVYKRNGIVREKTRDKKINNQELIFGFTHKDSFLPKEVNQKNRLTGNSHSMPKNKNIIHSNSTNQIRQQNKNISNKNNYNIININVNNLIINNNNKEEDNKKKVNNDNMNKVFSKIGSDIIGKNINSNDQMKKGKNPIAKSTRIGNQKNSVSVNKKSKYESLSNIQGVIDNLMEITKCPPPAFNEDSVSPQIEKKNNNILVNNNISSANLNNNIRPNKDNLICVDDNQLEIHIKLWEVIFNMELHVDNKTGLGNQIRKILTLIEKNFIPKETKTDIFSNSNLNMIYNKIIKIALILTTYIKFLLLDFNYEMTIKSNVKRLLSTVNDNLLTVISSYIFIKDNIIENNSCSKISKEFVDVYNKIIKMKKIRKNIKDSLINFCSNINKNLEISICSIKQFSNNFFKIGYFNPIHSIFFDMFRLLDTYHISDISNIIINYILFYILRNKQNDKKATAPKLVTFGNSNPLAALGFINIPPPYLPKIATEIEKNTYTLVLDLDETLVHFFYTPSGGTFLIRPFCFKFLEEMSKIFETVIFTAALKDYADSILDLLDPNKKLINYRLYRQHTSIYGITFVKDLSKIGRDLSRMIIIDNLGDNFKLQPDNGIQIGTWLDDMKDTQLEDLGKILKDMIEKKPNDIRPIIKKIKEEVNKKVRNNMNISPFKGVDVSKYFK